MTTHYLKIALRNMRRFKLQTIVCLTGLAVGMTCFALGTLWLRYIESFEDFVPEMENVCYVTGGQRQSGHGWRYYTHMAAGRNLQDSIAAIEAHCCILDRFEGDEEAMGFAAESGGGTVMLNVAEVDSLFFPFFGVEVLEGSAARLRPGDIVLTESAAERLFGKGAEAVGRPVRKTRGKADEEEVLARLADERRPKVHGRYTVAAVVRDCPRNTQFRYDALLPFSEMSRQMAGNNMFCTFVRMNRKARTDSIVGVPFRQTVNSPDPDHPSFMVTRESDYMLVPLERLRTDFPTESVDVKTEFVRWFMLIGVLVIACSLCNYLITMASHLRRCGWEFSLRRVLGSSRVHIIYMVCLETLLTFILATVLGFLLTMLALPHFRQYSGIDLPLSDIVPRLLAYLALVIASGMAVSALTAILVMRKTQRNILSSRQLSHSSPLLDRAGIVVQMSLSMGIIFALAVIIRQVNFLMYSDEIGFRHDRMGVVNINIGKMREEWRVRLRQSPLVEEMLENYAEMFPNRYPNGSKLRREKEGSRDDGFEADVIHIDSAFARFYGFQLVAGHLPVQGAFRHEAHVVKEIESLEWQENGDYKLYYHDVVHYPLEVCVNETMCRALGTTPARAIGLRLYDREEYRIVGVVKDMYTSGPTTPPKPTAYRHWEDSHVGASVLFRAKSGRTQELCDSIARWGEECDAGLNVVNCEREYEKYVASERMLINILMAVGGASLFVCVIGTFSLVSLSLQQRRKEIAVRKVHGARMKDILRLFLKGQVVSLCIAALLAYPVAYIIMKHWLEGYAKQIAIDWWLIPATFAAISAVVLATITLKIWRAAKESTVEALNS